MSTAKNSDVCSDSKDKVRRNEEEGLKCDDCGIWCHATCGNISRDIYKVLREREDLMWLCKNCKKEQKCNKTIIKALEERNKVLNMKLQELEEKWVKMRQDVVEEVLRKVKNEIMDEVVEEQASHIAKLAEENRRYILENGLMKKKKNSRGAHMNDVPSYDNMYNDRIYPDHGDNTEMEDKIMALQLQNSELSVCLEREKRLRKEAEARLEHDVGYIKRLEDSVQTLRGTRVIMDPSTYRQVAEAYMAAKRTPTRRPHTHNGVPGGLVCDATRNNVSDSRQSFSHPALHHTSSCPSAKSTSVQTSNPSYGSIEYPDVTSGLTKTKRDRGVPHQDRNRGFGVGTNTMNPWDYQQLLESLEDLDGGSSRGALS